MRTLLSFVALAALLVISCNKDKGYVKATVMDTGDVTVDGCGYLLRLEDGREEKPDYLPSNFQHNGLKVKVKYHSSGILDTCQFVIPRKFFEKIYIDDIKKDLD